MLKSHNPLDVDMAALKKGEVDLGTSMYLISLTKRTANILAWQSSSTEG
jgi:hypothetical protein